MYDAYPFTLLMAYLFRRREWYPRSKRVALLVRDRRNTNEWGLRRLRITSRVAFILRRTRGFWLFAHLAVPASWLPFLSSPGRLSAHVFPFRVIPRCGNGWVSFELGFINWKPLLGYLLRMHIDVRIVLLGMCSDGAALRILGARSHCSHISLSLRQAGKQSGSSLSSDDVPCKGNLRPLIDSRKQNDGFERKVLPLYGS